MKYHLTIEADNLSELYAFLKPEAKPEPKSEAKSEAKPEAKSEAKPEAKPKTQREVQDSVISLLSDGNLRSVAEIAKGIVVSLPVASAAISALMGKGHVVPIGEKYTLTQCIKNDDDLEYPPEDDD